MPDYTQKPGVSGPISRELDYALGFAKRFFDGLNLDLVITSLSDSAHKPGSLHPQGQAVDIRTRDLSGDERSQLQSYLDQNLSKQGYDILLEKDHLHIEYDPKNAAGFPSQPRQQPQQRQQQQPQQPAEKEPVTLEPYQLPMESKKVIILGVAIVLFLVAFARLK